MSGLLVIENFILIILGLAGGLAVGAGYVAFLTVLNIIPRLTQLTKTRKLLKSYELAVILGALWSGWSGLRDYSFNFSDWSTLPIGLFSGIFIGMLAAALTEVLNVIPVLTKRVGMNDKLMLFMLAIIFGKMLGSLFQWLYFVIG
ncbi:stage V sporulation protein AB [Bacillus niameyensis]|uniref:stage V sporulation protein AB n=1 Tax=Bacillus niameyensis TaxID=1522308 RepID=UPI0007858FC1|nr:stage V sporulation protein AB [Bacillus niameyensis]